MFITKDTKWHLLCCCHDNSSAAGPVLIKTTIPSFCLNQGPSTPPNLMVRVQTIWLPCLFKTGASVLLWRVENEERDKKRLEPKEWQLHYGYYIVSFVMNISGVKFEEHYFHISRDIIFIQYFTIFKLQTSWRHHLPILHNTKTSISLKWKKIFQKGKHHYFFEESILFHFIGT